MTFKALLKELFIGNETDLLEQLKNLDKKQRDNLNKEFKPIFSLIEEAQQIQHKKNFSYEEFYNFIKENPEKFITEQWEKIKKTGSLKYPKNYVDFMLRLQILKVGLYPQKEMKKVFKFDNYYAENTNNSNFILNMTNTLLARKEDWVKSFLLEFFENFENGFLLKLVLAKLC
jgi:hypothetical protein